MDNSMNGDGKSFVLTVLIGCSLIGFLFFQVRACASEQQAFHYINKQLELEHQLKTQTK